MERVVDVLQARAVNDVSSGVNILGDVRSNLFMEEVLLMQGYVSEQRSVIEASSGAVNATNFKHSFSVFAVSAEFLRDDVLVENVMPDVVNAEWFGAVQAKIEDIIALVSAVRIMNTISYEQASKKLDSMQSMVDFLHQKA